MGKHFDPFLHILIRQNFVISFLEELNFLCIKFDHRLFPVEISHHNKQQYHQQQQQQQQQ